MTSSSWRCCNLDVQTLQSLENEVLFLDCIVGPHFHSRPLCLPCVGVKNKITIFPLERALGHPHGTPRHVVPADHAEGSRLFFIFRRPCLIDLYSEKRQGSKGYPKDLGYPEDLTLTSIYAPIEDRSKTVGFLWISFFSTVHKV